MRRCWRTASASPPAGEGRSARARPFHVSQPRRVASRTTGAALLAATALFLAAAFVLAFPSGAGAHQLSLSTARIQMHADRTVDLDVALAGADVDRMAETRVFSEKSGLVEPEKLAASARPILAWFGAHVALQGVGGAPCEAEEGRLSPDKDGVAFRQTWSCARVPGEILYRSTLLTATDPQARQVVMIGSGENALQALLDAATTDVVINGTPPSLLEVLRLYALTGVEHIFLGYDHVAFLVAIVLWARRLWPVLKIVTAFTVAHSITLSLAALDVVALPGSLVEPAIAASIMVVAAENFFSRNVDGRWLITFAFGLIHGFGFASALQAFGLPANAVAPALAAFNIGVEIGQLVIVSLVVPALIALDRLLASPLRLPIRTAQLVYALSGVITILGGYWLLSRLPIA